MPDEPHQPSRQKFISAASRRLPDFVFGNLHGSTLTQRVAELIDRVMGQTGFSWRWNTPYAGGYITRHYGLTTNEHKDIPTVEVLQIEVNRRLCTYQKDSKDNAKMMFVKKVIENIVTALTDR